MAGNHEGGGGGWEAPLWLRRTGLAVGALALVGILFWALRPQPVGVDLTPVERGTVEVAVEEDGRTRVRDRYRITAPVGGTLERLTLEPGDSVAAGQVVARIEGAESGVPDARTRAQLEARLQAARAGVGRAEAMVEAAEAGVFDAREELRRQQILRERGGGSTSALERAEALLRAREAEVRSAGFTVRASEGEVEELRLALARPAGPGTNGLEVRSPVQGQVLQRHRESGGAVTPGEALLEIGDPSRLEIVVDLLSADAVRVPEGAEAVLRRWGGEEDLPARVRRVEPAGFTRVSALGIEEQRVHVLLDPTGEAPGWERLGDGFRVEARILVDRVDDVLRVPAGALFRAEAGWAVFVAAGGRIEERGVEIGRRSPTQVEIRAGLEEGDRVVVFPGDQVADGVRFRER